MRRAGWALALAVLGTATPTGAQAPDGRRALLELRDSAAASVDTAGLVHLAEQYEDMHDGGPEAALARIFAGFLRVSAGQPLRGKKDFERAAKLEPTWPAPWLGIGDAHQALGLRSRTNRLNLGTVPGRADFHKAAAAYGRALEFDPHFTPAIEAELRLAAETRDTALLAIALQHARALPPGAATPAFRLALSRAEWRFGDVAAARATALAVPDTARSPALRYELARAMLAAGDPYGEVYYWKALASDEPDMLAMVRRDLAIIASAEELAVIDSVDGPGLVAFMEEFWDRRGAQDLRPAGERLAEHYERLAYADRYFAFSDARRWHKPDDLLSSFPFDSTLDSRGVVYVRMGPPDVRVAPTVTGLSANETWEYRRTQDTLLLHFSAQNSIGDYVLVRSPLETRCHTRGGCDMPELYFQLRDVNDTFRRLQTAGPVASSRYMQQLHVLAKRSIATSASSDAHPLRFPASVTAQVLPLAIGAAPGGSRVQIAVAREQPVEVPGRRIDTLRIRFAAFDTSGTAVARLDSTLVYPAPASRAPDDTVRTVFGRFETTLPAGTWEWKVAVQSGDSAGALMHSQPITVSAHDGSILAVSDLAIGIRGWAAPWIVAPGDTAWLTPRHTHRASQPVSLYYEVYGTPAGQLLHTEVTARLGTKPTEPSMTLGFEERSRGTRTQVLRTIDLQQLEPGDYTLEVRVRDAAGRTAVSSRPITIVKE